MTPTAQTLATPHRRRIIPHRTFTAMAPGTPVLLADSAGVVHEGTIVAFASETDVWVERLNDTEKVYVVDVAGEHRAYGTGWMWRLEQRGRAEHAALEMAAQLAASRVDQGSGS